MTSRAAKKRFYDKRKQQRRCVECGQDTVGKTIRCAACAVRMGQAQKVIQKERSQKRVCVQCGNPSICNNYKIQTKSQLGELTKACYCQGCYLKKLSLRTFGTSSRWSELLEIFNAQGGTCSYTGNQIVIGESASLDHKEPCLTSKRNRGTSADISNLHWVRWDINFMKRDLSEDEFIANCKAVAKRFS